jgi:glutamyl-tRNA synthetase
MTDVDLPDAAVELIEKVALKNAVEHDGTAQAGPVISALLGDYPEVKQDMASVKPFIDDVVAEVNEMSVDEQREDLLAIDPEALESEDPNTDPLKEIEIEAGSDVVTAFPPAPEKYPHIGHAKALFLNHDLARRYDGEFILRFDDSNPLNVEEEYYEAMLEDFEALDVSFDDVVYASDHMQLFYQKCEDLIESGDAYVADESAERISDARRSEEALLSRSNSVAENKELWESFVRGDLDDAVVLLKGDMEHQNTTMRDPALMRQVEGTHPRQGDRFDVWPTYDFQTACLDGEYGITHRVRSKEFELRNELHAHMQALLGYDGTEIYEFARFEVEGAIVSGREIREGIRSGQFSGWDDPQLMTLRALRKRGFQPAAIREFVLATGLSKTEAKRPIDELYQANYDAVSDASDNALFIETPSYLDAGDHRIIVDASVSHDLEAGTVYESWDGSTFTIDGDEAELVHEAGEERVDAVLEDKVNSVELFMPDGSTRRGSLFVDGDYETNNIVRIKNVGFARIDDTATNTLWFAH